MSGLILDMRNNGGGLFPAGEWCNAHGVGKVTHGAGRRADSGYKDGGLGRPGGSRQIATLLLPYDA